MATEVKTSPIARDIIADALVLYKCSDNPDTAAERIVAALHDAGFRLEKHASPTVTVQRAA
ncbi:MAG: hypothetical protein ACAH80_08655 [Alphaproteobacteria bacterium]